MRRVAAVSSLLRDAEIGGDVRPRVSFEARLVDERAFEPIESGAQAGERP